MLQREWIGMEYNWFRFHRSVRAHTTTKTSISSKWLFFSLVLSRFFVVVKLIRAICYCGGHTHTLDVFHCKWYVMGKIRSWQTQILSITVEMQPNNARLIQMEFSQSMHGNQMNRCMQSCGTLKWAIRCFFCCWCRTLMTAFVKKYTSFTSNTHTQRSHIGCICLTYDSMAFNHHSCQQRQQRFN